MMVLAGLGLSRWQIPSLVLRIESQHVLAHVLQLGVAIGGSGEDRANS